MARAIPATRRCAQAIAARYGVTPDQVVAADGTSMANFLAMAALISPGDEVLVEHPTYEPLLGAASFLGAEIKRFERKAADAFRLDPARSQAAMSDRTRLIVVTNLHNPSCALADEAELRAIGELAGRGRRARAGRRGLSRLPRFRRARSAVHLGPEFVCTNSLTKVYGLSGLRCGWILAEPELAERMWRLNDLFGVNQAHPAERLACIAFDHIDEVIGDNPAMLERNRERCSTPSSPHAKTSSACLPSMASPPFPRWAGGDTDALDAHLRERYDTAVVPGRWFEMPDHFRVGFGLRTERFRRGADPPWRRRWTNSR